MVAYGRHFDAYGSRRHVVRQTMAAVPWQRNLWECQRKMAEEDGVRRRECLRKLGAWGNLRTVAMYVPEEDGARTAAMFVPKKDGAVLEGSGVPT
jgi:hypothetical protein